MGDDIVETVTGTPESFGWQRRPDLDTELNKAYERPDGQIYLAPNTGNKTVLVRLKNPRKLWDKPDADE